MMDRLHRHSMLGTGHGRVPEADSSLPHILVLVRDDLSSVAAATPMQSSSFLSRYL